MHDPDGVCPHRLHRRHVDVVTLVGPVVVVEHAARAEIFMAWRAVRVAARHDDVHVLARATRGADRGPQRVGVAHRFAISTASATSMTTTNATTVMSRAGDVFDPLDRRAMTAASSR